MDFEVTPGSKGRLSVEVPPKRLSANVLCKGYETSKVVAKQCSAAILQRRRN